MPSRRQHLSDFGNLASWPKFFDLVLEDRGISAARMSISLLFCHRVLVD